MIFGSVCSGIEAASVAWEPLGWRCAFLSEIDPFACAVLAHRFPQVPLHGDFRTIEDGMYEPIDVLIGGPPCQDFSVAGLREGMSGERGSLTLEFARLARRLKPRYIVYENVAGLLSSNGGRDFGSFLGALADGGFGLAWRVYDAKFFGVPQRRRRVFLIGCARADGQRAAEILFDGDGVCRHSHARSAARKAVAALTASGVGACGADDNQAQAGHLIAHTLRGDGFDASEDGTGRGTPLVPVTFVAQRYGVRRLMPVETERLQGFPDGWTDVPYRGKPAADGPRYRAIGNSMAVPVVAWLGRRINEREHTHA